LGSTQHLASVKEFQSTRKINISNIVSDLLGTAASVGAPDELINEALLPYLQTVAAEARKAKPNQKLMKMALEQSAVALDEYISDTLHQKSTVVKEWVDALLMQDVAWKADAPIDVGATTTDSDTSRSLEQAIQSAASHQIPLNPDEKADVRQLMKQATESARSKDYETALIQYDQALGLIEGKNNRQLEGQIWYYKGLSQWRQGDLDSAHSHLEQGLVVLKDSTHEALKSKIHHALGQTYSLDGQLDPAIDHYKEKLLVDTRQSDERGQIQSLTALGQLLMRQKDNPQAKQALSQALTLAQAYQHPSYLGQIYNYLGVLSAADDEHKAAYGLYKQALKVTKGAKARQIVYQNMAALFLKTNKPHQAMAALKKALAIVPTSAA
jgi:tetratricopeptide (TPR) repeat protein